MGKRIIQRARGKGSLTYRVRAKAFKHKIGYPNIQGKGIVLKLFNSAGHSAPLSKIKIGSNIFYNPATKGLFEGQEIEIGGSIKEGNIVYLKDVPTGTKLHNIEIHPGDGGKIMRVSGSYGILTKKLLGKVAISLSNRKELLFLEKCRATVGETAGAGRLDKPIFKAGKKYHMMKAKSKLWPRTSAVAMNVIDHPFGSGRGKRITHGTKGKIPKRNAPPGANVGTIRPRRTGRRKGRK
ncbi:MAG: 50S ribosomal protein L2 [archaeon]